MKKIGTIAWKEVYLTFTDRNLILIMIATPLLISSIIGMAFGGLAEEGGVPFSDIPVVIVNQDEGAEQYGESYNFGQEFVAMMIPAESADGAEADFACPLITGSETASEEQGVTLGELVEAETMDSVEAAKAAVRDGDYAAAVIIPAGFSWRLLAPGEEADAAVVEVYGDSGQPIFVSVIQSITAGFTDRLLTGNIAIAASNAQLQPVFAANPRAGIALGTNADIQSLFNCGFTTALNVVDIQPQPVDPDANALSGFSEVLVFAGAPQAVFFALFTGQFGVISIIEERRAGTLQRLVVSPTSRFTILVGKLVGTLVTVIFQLVVLLIAFVVVASVADDGITMMWGTNMLGIIAVVLALGVAVCGYGVLISGFAKTPEQVGSFGSVVNIIMAMFGGAFGVEFGSPFSEISLVYWGKDAFTELSSGGTDILLNLAVLLAMGVVMFVIGWQLFGRQLDV